MNYQGAYGAGNILLIFVDGKAYYRPYDSPDEDSDFSVVAGLQLDADVDYIYAELIPGSTINFKRTRSTIDGLEQEYVILTDPIAGSPAAAFVTDGINQSVLIFPDGTWRVTNTYLQWTQDDREYVPIGTLPQYIDGILYLAGKDLNGKLTRIYRSVTGRPIDFMINVDVDGNKSHPSDEETYGAPGVAHRVSFNEITAINRIVVGDGAFFVSTRQGSWLVIPQYETLIFSEPKFRNQFLFSTGVLNQFSTTDLLGTTALIDGRLVSSFDAISALKSEGKNAPFTQKIFRLFEGVEQTVTCATNFDNYALFSVLTIYGAAVIVYDVLTKVFVSVDLYPGIGAIKQFCEIKINGLHSLFFITDEAAYQMYGSDETAICRYYFGELSTNDNKEEHKGRWLFALLDQIKEAGTLQVTAFTDRKRIDTKAFTVKQLMDTPGAVQSVPYNTFPNDTGEVFPFSFENTPFGSRLGFLISWNCAAMLSLAQCITETRRQTTTLQREGNINEDHQLALIQNSPLILCVTGNDGVISTARNDVVLAIKSEAPDFVLGAGNHNYPEGSEQTVQEHIADYWNYFIRNTKAYFALGNVDLDTNNGGPAILYYLYGMRYFNRVLRSDLCDLFVINSGLNSAGDTVEPDGITETSTQALWLRDMLALSTSPWKIVMGHGLCTWPLKTWGASFYLNANSNYYEHIQSNGFDSFTVGLGGYTKSVLPAEEAEGSVKRYNGNFGYLRAQLTEFEASFEFKLADGTIIDSYIIHL